MTERAGLRVYVVYSPEFAHGANYARHIALQFDRLGETRERTPSATCTRVRCSLLADGAPRPIDWSLGEVNVVIFLTEGRLLQSLETKEWRGLCQAVVDRQRSHPQDTLLVNVALTQTGVSLPGWTTQPLHAYAFRSDYSTDLEDASPNKPTRQILLSLLAVVGRFLQRRLPGSAERGLRVFVSHTSKLGRTLAVDVAHRLDEVQALGAFLDSTSLQPAEDFNKNLLDGIQNGVFLAIYTDDYSERRYTRWEMLKAKQYRRPILVVHLLQTGESRTFPYAFNTPLRVVAWRWRLREDPDAAESVWATSRVRELDQIIFALMAETLRVLLFDMEVARLIANRPTYADHFPRAIELVDLAHLAPLAAALREESIRIAALPEEERTAALLKKRRTEVIYPDPPLDASEAELIAPLLAPLTAMPISELRGVAPIKRSPIGGPAEPPGPLEGRRVAVSAGTVSPAELDRLGIPALAIDPAEPDRGKAIRVTAIDHALAASVTVITQLGGCVIYGGDLRANGFTARLFDEVADATRRLELGGRYWYEHHLAWSAWRKERGQGPTLPLDALFSHVRHHQAVGQVHLYLPQGSALVFRWQSEKAGVTEILVTGDGPGTQPYTGEIRAANELVRLYADTNPPEGIDEGSALTAMRQRMAQRESARVIFAGKTTGHSGHFPGVAEEAWETLQAGKLLLVCGGFGGAALDVGEALGLVTSPMPRPNDERGTGYSDVMGRLRQHRDAYHAGLQRRGLDLADVQALARSDNPAQIADLLRKLLLAA